MTSLFDDANLHDIDEVMEWASRPWYRYGWRSLGILVARTRNAHPWGFQLRMAWQRARRGYGDDDLWNLNHALAKLIVAGTSYMREYGHGHPMGTEPDEWNGTLDVIRLGFQEWLDADGWLEPGSDVDARFKDAQANLAHWWDGLWD